MNHSIKKKGNMVYLLLTTSYKNAMKQFIGAGLLGEHAGFITGMDLLIDGGVIAAIRTGAYKLHG